MTALDTNNIKFIGDLAISSQSVFLSLIAGAVTDTSANPSVFTPTVPVQNFFPDMVPPTLVAFSLDMNAGALSLTFDEIVRISTVLVNQIRIMHSSVAAEGVVQITNNSQLSLYINSVVVSISIGQMDLDQLKLAQNIATSAGNSVLFAAALFAKDMRNNAMVPVPALACAQFVPDTTSPLLSSFGLDMNTDKILLSFNEPILGSSLVTTDFELQGSTGKYYNVSFGPTSSLCSWNSSYNGRMIVIFVGKQLSNALKKDRIYSYSQISVVLLNGSLTDMIGNNILAVDQVASSFVNDTTPPNGVDVSIINGPDGENQLKFVFDETIDIATVNYASVTILSAGCPSKCTTFTLSGGVPVPGSDDSTIFVFEFSPTDIIGIKQSEVLRWNISQASVSFATGFIRDMYTTPIVPATFLVSSAVSPFAAPRLLSWMVNVNAQYLVLNFNEPVAMSTLNVSKLILQSAEIDDGVHRYRLTPSSSTNSSDGLQAFISISDFDANGYRRLDVMLLYSNTSYLQLESGFIYDLVYQPNPSVSIAANAGMPASMFVRDYTSPYLLSFNLDMNTGVLTFFFSKVVRAASLLPTELTIQLSSNANALQSLSLTGGFLLTTADDLSVQLKLLNSDLNVVKQRFVALFKPTTWITFSADFIADMAGDKIIPSVNGLNSFPVSGYIPDMTSPVLQSFEANFDSGILTLNFDETILVNSFKVTSFHLVLPSASVDFQLTNSSSLVSGSINAPTVFIQIGLADMNKIKNIPQLFKSNASSFLSIVGGNISDAGFTDMSGNPMVGVANFPADDYSRDQTSPIVTSLQVDLSLERIYISFNEPVEGFGNASAVTLLSNSTIFNYTLSSFVDLNRSLDGMSLTFQLSTPDLNEIKKDTNLLKSASSTFLAIASGAFFDVSYNSVALISPWAPLQASSFYPDLVRPVLDTFSVDLTARIVTLIFSETVLVSSLDTSSLTFFAPQSNQSFTLTNSSYSQSVNDPTVLVKIGKRDFDELKKLRTIVTGSGDTFIAIQSTAIIDMNGNSVVPTSMPTAHFTRDSIPPYLVSWSVNLTSEILSLTFSETVRSPSLSIPALLL